MSKKILYNYKPYVVPRNGLFSITTDEYKLPDGWVAKEEIRLIIGEADGMYVERLADYSSESIIPIGLHESRLVRWCETQLELFS